MALEELKERIKETPISRIIGHYLELQRKGATLAAVCPFHDDHNPSMSVNDTKNMFYCFVDQTGGDSIKFVQLYKRLEFIDALKEICSIMGWNFDDFDERRKDSPKLEMAKKILSKTAQLYKKIGTSHQYPAFKDFLDNRGISDEIAHTFMLGFAPAQNSLLKYLQSIPTESERNFALQIAEELELIRHKNQSQFDTFRDRVMFPIWDQFGQVVGFTGRSVHKDQNPKYYNSKESFIFKKGQILYGLHLAKPIIRERDAVILVEGNMDQLNLFAHGFQNTVAIMGTAFGESSLQKIMALTHNVFLCLDGDQAGVKATDKINAMFMSAGITPKSLDLTPHKDADDFIKSEGSVSFKQRLDTAQVHLDRQIDAMIPKEIPDILEKKLSLLHSIYPVLAPLKANMLATERLVACARRIGLKSDPATVVGDYEKFLNGLEERARGQNRPVPAQQGHEITREVEDDQEEISEPVMPSGSAPHIAITRLEKTLVQELVQHPELLQRKEMAELLDFVSSDEVKEFVLRLKNLFYEIDETEYETMVAGLLGADQFGLELSTTASAALYRYRASTLNDNVVERMVKDLKQRLNEDFLRHKREDLMRLSKTAESSEEQDHYLRELSQIDKKLSVLRAEGQSRKSSNL